NPRPGGAAQEGAVHRRGAPAREEPAGGVVRVPEGPVPRKDPCRDRGGCPARRARVVPRRQAERRDPPPDRLMTRSLKLGGAGALVLLLVLAATWTVRRLDGEDRTVAVTGTIEALQVDGSAKITARV